METSTFINRMTDRQLWFSCYKRGRLLNTNCGKRNKGIISIVLSLNMESAWKILVFCMIWYNARAAVTTIDLLPARVTRNAEYLTPISTLNNAHTTAVQTKIYTTKNTHSIDDFVTRPQIKSTKIAAPSISDRPLYTSYAPPPSGIIAYKNLELPLSAHAAKIPIVVPQNELTQHPGFYVTPRPHEDNAVASSQMLMIEESPAVVLQAQHNKTIEAAKILASTILEASGELPLESGKKSPNATTDVYIVKSQKKAYVIPTHTRIRNDVSKSSAVEDLYSMRNQLEKAYTINQFIFVIKPEKINFLNKLV